MAEFYQRSKSIAQQVVGDNYEIIMVNDGSPDNSLEIAMKLAKTENNLTIVDLSRNFGHHKALMSGLSHASGKLIYLIDSDLEEEPEWLLNFFEELKQNKCDVIYGVQEKRKGKFIEKLLGRLYYFITSLMLDVKLPKNQTTARLMTNRFVDALLLHKEREIIIGGIYELTGFNQKPHIVTKHSSSKSTYTNRMKFRLAIDTITSFSSQPLIFIFYFGMILFLISSSYAFFLSINHFFLDQNVDGWTSLMVSVWFLGGIIISFIGIIGIYLSKVYSEAKNRPNVIVKKIYKNEN